MSRPASPPRAAPASPGMTLLACGLTLLAALLALGRMTAGFGYWTFEAQRRHQAATGQLAFPAMPLVDASGRTWQLPAGGSGQVMLVAFMYTDCASVCQVLGSEFYQVQQRIRSAGSGIRLLSVSVDPARDTPAALARYARLHGAGAPLWRVSAPASVAAGSSSRRQLGIIAIDDGAGGWAHNGALHVVDRQGRVRGIFDTADWRSALALAQRLEAAAP